LGFRNWFYLVVAIWGRCGLVSATVNKCRARLDTWVRHVAAGISSAISLFLVLEIAARLCSVHCRGGPCLADLSASPLSPVGSQSSPVTGVALFFVCAVRGRLPGASVHGHFGGFGVPARPFTPGKGLGLILVVLGVILVWRS